MTTVAEPAVAAAPSAGTGLAVTSLFQGYNSFLATGAQSALTGTSQSVGAKQRINYTVCTSIEDILNSLDIDTSVSYTSPEYSASAKLNYAHSLHVTEHTVTVVIYANRIIATTQATRAQLAGSAPTPDTLKAFCTQYGDSWVNSLTTGAEYFAAYCFYAETKDEQTSELYPEVVDACEEEGGVPSRLMKTEAGDGRQEGTPCQMFAGSPSGRTTRVGSRSMISLARERVG